MNIEPDLAQNIVVSMKEIIEQEINYISTEGIIIASTDENRIGNSHGGAKEVIRTKSDIVIEYEGQYKGTKKGINIPIYTDSQLVGVIGITGEFCEVEKYGKIIKRMTEILIKDAWIKEVSFKKRENYRVFFEQIISESVHSRNTQHLATLLEIDMDLPRIALVGSIKDYSKVSDERLEDLKNLIKLTLIEDIHNIYHLNGAEIRMCLNGNQTIKYLSTQFDTLIKSAQEQLNITLHFGFGTTCENMLEYSNSYNQAMTALKWATINSDQYIQDYNDIDLGLILADLPRENKVQFTNKILGALSEEELKEYSELLNIYGKNNGSNYKTANELFIHKNTIQYKLIKLEKLTGYDPRELDDYVVLSIAFLLWNSGKD